MLFNSCIYKSINRKNKLQIIAPCHAAYLANRLHAAGFFVDCCTTDCCILPQHRRADAPVSSSVCWNLSQRQPRVWGILQDVTIPQCTPTFSLSVEADFPLSVGMAFPVFYHDWDDKFLDGHNICAVR